jgi:DNA-binding transcriptional LysR family regulator
LRADGAWHANAAAYPGLARRGPADLAIAVAARAGYNRKSYHRTELYDLVELTPCGSLLVERARIIFDEVRQDVREIEHASDPSRGEVRIGATEPLTVILAEIINGLSARCPSITYNITTSDTTTLMRELRERNLDVVITRWTSRTAADDLVAEPLYNNRLGVLVHRLIPCCVTSGWS